MRRMKLPLAFTPPSPLPPLVLSAQTGSDARKILSVDHKVTVKSIVPAIAGQPAQIYVRERVADGLTNPAPIASCCSCTAPARRPKSRSTCRPAITAGWRYLAKAGFDVFSMDTTGYGRSTRPAPMNDPCNLSAEQQKQFVPTLIPAPCKATYPGQLTDDRLRLERHRRRRRSHPQAAQRARRSAWSRGRSAGRAPAAMRRSIRTRCNRLVLLAPAYNRDAPPRRRRRCRDPAPCFNTQSRSEFDANWDRQVGCANQFDPKVREAVWAEMLASDPGRREVGHRRAPRAVDDDVGLERGDDRRHEDADVDDRRRCTTSRCRPIACALPTTTSARATRC